MDEEEKIYNFKIVIAGTGRDAEEAWRDACEGFSMEPGPMDPQSIELTEPVELTIEQKYMRSGGVRCPYCDSDNISAEPIESDIGCASGDVHCKSCGKSWKDYYDLSGMEPDEEGDT